MTPGGYAAALLYIGALYGRKLGEVVEEEARELTKESAMQLKEIMTPSPAAIASDNSVCDAAKKMQSLNVGFLPVSENNEPIGVITDRDITIRCVAENLDLAHTAVREVMSPTAQCLSEHDSLEEAARLMKEKQIRRVLVADDNGHVCGVVSLGDLAVHTRDPELSGQALEEISEPAHPNR